MRIALLATLISCSIFHASFAETPQPHWLPKYNSAQDDATINHYYRTTSASHSSDKTTRIIAASNLFLGKPYELGALGEGVDAEFDQHPLYRTDAFDCLTYVATVLALANADNLAQFKKNMIAINYRDGKAHYVNRNHFMTVDWNPTVQHLGFMRDITHQIQTSSAQPAAEVANTIINKPNWYRQKKLDSLALQQRIGDAAVQSKLQTLQNLSNEVKAEKAVLLYIPFSQLFDEQQQPKQAMFDQIPNGAIVEIVRPNWDIENAIGTRMHVSHLGFAIRTDKGLIFREATSKEGKVIDILLTDYLKAYLNSPTVKGIHIEKTT